MRTLILLTAGLVALSANAAEVYRYIDENGLIAYSDRPPEGDVQILSVETVPDTRAPRPARSAPAARQSESTSTAVNEEVVAKAEAAQQAEEQAANCATARERQQAYAISHRLFRELPNGDREYLTDAEIDSARAEADALVARWCN